MRSWIIFLSCLCSACVSTETYPDNWPTREAVGADCADISGVYNDEGNSARVERTRSGLHDYALSTFFFGEDPNNYVHAIAISQSSVGEIVVKALINDRVVRSRTFSLDDDYECADGRIWFSAASWEFETLPVMPLYGTENIRFGFVKAVDDSLIARFRWFVAGAWGIVPFTDIKTDYILWTVWPLDPRV